jgi:hypothetical protein
MSKVVSDGFCFAKGHNIVAMVVREVYEVELKSMVPERETFCVQCGKSRDEILNEKPAPPRRRGRAVKGADPAPVIDNIA